MATKQKEAKRLLKQEFLEYWAELEPGQELPITPVPYEHTGSTYSEDCIRITGSRDFVDAVLSRFKDLLQREAAKTRLHVTYQEIVDRDLGIPTGSWAAYIQVHERGREAKIANSLFGNVTYQPVATVSRKKLSQAVKYWNQNYGPRLSQEQKDHLVEFLLERL